MKKSTLLILVVFVALLGGGTWFLTQKQERGIERLDLAVNADLVDRLVISGKNPVELKKEGDTWKLANGREADKAGVTRVVQSLGKLKSSDKVSLEGDKEKELELDSEKGTRVQAFGGGKELLDVTLGKASGMGVVVKHDGTAFRVAGVTPSQFNKPTSSWVERKIFTDKADDVTRVTVKLAGQAPYSLAKKDNVWQLEDASILPKGFRFDSDGARSIVTALVSLRAKDFEETAPAADKTGLSDAADAWTFEVAGAEGALPTARTVRLGSVKEGAKELYAQVEGRADVFTVPESTAKSLRKAATDLRDLKLMAFDITKVKKLSITEGKNSLSLEKKAEGWTVVKSSEKTPAGFEFDGGMVERRLGAIANAKAMKVAGAALGGQTAKLTLTLDDGKSVSLTFGKEAKEDDKDVYYAQGNADGEVYVLNKFLRNSLTGGLLSFKKQAEAPGGMGGLDPAALSSLPPEVRENLLKQMRDQQRQQDLMKSFKKQ